MAIKPNDLRLLEMARDRGLIDNAQLDRLIEEHTHIVREGHPRSPTRLAIEKGILSEENTRDLETAAWIADLPSLLGDYRIARLLGRGGMAVVFEAQDVSLGKVVAVKVLLPDFSSSETYLARFHREARIAARLTHPNTVQVFRAGETNGIHYLVMEYVDGETLSDILKNRGRIPEAEAIEIVLDLTGALEEAATMSIVHRDIKPGNIIMSKWGLPKLADFGIAKELSDISDPRIQASLTLGVVGTPNYMSPEQARGMRHLDFRSDIYSLGTTLYHMVVGDLPFSAETPQETMFRVVSESPRPPRAAFPDLSAQTAAVICKMMAKAPEDRYATYEALRADLADAREGAEVSIEYRDAVQLLAPAAGDAVGDEEPASPLRVLAVAVGVVIIGMVLLWLARGCVGP